MEIDMDDMMLYQRKEKRSSDISEREDTTACRANDVKSKQEIN